MKNVRRHVDVKSIKRATLAAVAAAGIALPTALSAQEAAELEAIEIISATPLFGGEIDVDKIPTPVTSVTTEDFSNVPTGTVQNVLQKNAPGVIVVDLQGSDFQNEIRFRGFAASPVNGVPQGIAVYQNGVRINEAFGDIVNFDFLPEGAIESIDLQTANPVFGLNAIGGSLNIKMRDGFTFQGVETIVEAGSFGRKSASIAGGTLSESGNFAAFVALDLIDDDGYRDFSESKVRRVYADIGHKTSKSEFHLNYTGAANELGVVAASPEPLLDLDWANTFTSPQVTDKEVHMFSINGEVDLTENLKLSGVGYYRRFRGNILDGNLSEGEACEPDDNTIIDTNGNPVVGYTDDQLEDFLCGEEEDGEQPLLYKDAAGTIPYELDDLGDISGFADADDIPYGSIDKINQDAESYGGTLQTAHDGKLFGRSNKLVVGASIDHGKVRYSARSEPGLIGNKNVVEGSGQDIEAGGEFNPRLVDAENTYFGAYFTNVTDLTDRLTLTVGGRYNYAKIELEDLTGNFDDLNTTQNWERFNPMVGATYEFVPGFSFYGSYAEANRTPTGAELACADPEEPCPIESFLTDDPPLDQVVTKTYEAGIRGKASNIFGGSNNLDFSFGYFHATNEDDILSIAAEEQGRGFFDNKGDTRREGFEASVKFAADRFNAYVNYSYTEATYLDAFDVPATGNPGFTECEGDDPGEFVDCVKVQPGDRIPGIPEHIFKAGFDYYVTPKWMVGADIIATSDQVFLGDEGNVASKLSGYEKVDIRTSYDITDKVQIFGYVENIFDKEYGLFGNFFSFESSEYAEAVAEAGGYDEDVYGTPNAEDEVSGRTIVPNKPVAAYVGLKIKLD